MSGVVDLADVRFARAVEGLHGLGPHSLFEMLLELAATRLLRTEIEAIVWRYARINSAVLTAAGGDQHPLTLISERLDAALGHLRDAEADVADPVVLHALDMLAVALEDARDLASGQGGAS